MQARVTVGFNKDSGFYPCLTDLEGTNMDVIVCPHLAEFKTMEEANEAIPEFIKWLETSMNVKTKIVGSVQ